MASLFSIAPAPTFRANVRISKPGGGFGEIDIEFRHKPKKAIKEWVDGSRARSDLEVISEVVAGWSGVADESGALVRYSPEALEQLIENYPSAARELFAAYLRELTEARAKN